MRSKRIFSLLKMSQVFKIDFDASAKQVTLKNIKKNISLSITKLEPEIEDLFTFKVDRFDDPKRSYSQNVLSNKLLGYHNTFADMLTLCKTIYDFVEIEFDSRDDLDIVSSLIYKLQNMPQSAYLVFLVIFDHNIDHSSVPVPGTELRTIA